ncbi:MAG: imidazoleglycerol-phosphate dehydratase HisB [Clostridia bacterium]|nr:imidazoleglycerol-phosphate dehydratase HisB [Clostridia bacterium]
MRQAEMTRVTNETDITLSLDLDGTGCGEINSGCGFLDHMLTLFARHGRFDLSVTCKGDTQVDDHHTTEDIGIALGEAFKKALGDKRGITRYGSCMLPMDEALVMSAADLSGRVWLSYDVTLPTQKVGTFDTELGKEFWLGFVRGAEMTLHFKMFSGDNSHHILEACFKSAARSLRQAVRIDPELQGEIPSTKGVL